HREWISASGRISSRSTHPLASESVVVVLLCSMNTTFTPFLSAYIDDAARLLADAYAAERLASPSLPAMERLGGGRGRRLVEDELGKLAGNAGVAAFESGRLCGFMVESMRFPWKGQQVAGCEELAHAADGADRARLYSLLYQEI